MPPPLAPRRRPGELIFGALLLVIALPLIALALQAEGGPVWRPAERTALWFTVWQATLSALLSVALGQLLARALIRRRFPGRGALIAALSAPFVLPVITAILGLLACFGPGGLFADAAAWLGLPWGNIYGLHGVVLAHLFFNLPLAARVFLNAYAATPPSDLRLARALGLGWWARLRVIDWPVTARAAPGALGLIFVLCTTSFSVALTMGGGPRATTLELAIYQAMRLEFDIARAVWLALAQILLAGGALLMLVRLARLPGWEGEIAPANPEWPGAEGVLSRTGDTTLILAACAFLGLPLAVMLSEGLGALPRIGPEITAPLIRSIALALASAVIGAGLTLALLPLRDLSEALSAALLALSPLVFGAGLYVMLRPLATPGQIALPVTVLVNALAALPLMLRVVRPAWEEAREAHGRLSLSLGLSGARFRNTVLWPALAGPLGFAMGLAAALSAGDLGVIVLLGGPEQATLPLAILHLMRAYRMEDAMAAALLLGLVSAALLVGFDKGGRALARL